MPHFERISKEFFQVTADLSSNEKAMLLCLRQCYKGEQPETYESIKFFSLYLGLSESKVRHQFKALLSKGYLRERHWGSSKGSKSTLIRYFNNDKQDWRYLYNQEKIEQGRNRFWFDLQKSYLAEKMDVSHLVFDPSQSFSLIMG